MVYGLIFRTVKSDVIVIGDDNRCVTWHFPASGPIYPGRSAAVTNQITFPAHSAPARVTDISPAPDPAPPPPPPNHSGQERFGSMTRVYYKEAVAAFIVFDVTRSVTFDAVMKWKNDLDQKVQLPNGDCVPCVLLANKVMMLAGLLEEVALACLIFDTTNGFMALLRFSCIVSVTR